MSFPKYPEYKDSGVEWLGEVPAHWEVPRLKHLARIRNGRDYKNVEVETGGYPVIGSGGEFSRADSYLYKGESVLLGRKGTIDKPLYIDGPFWTVDTMFYTELSPRVDGRFLFYYATCFRFDLYSTNTALPSMAQEDLANIQLAAPEPDEQAHIAAFLDHETARIDALVEEQQRLIELLKEKRQAVISHAVTKGLDPDVPMKDSGVEWLGEVPAHWEALPLKYLVREPLKYGANEAASDNNADHPRFVRITDVAADGTLRDETFRSLPPDVAKQYLLEEGDILFARSGATVGKSFLYKRSWGECCFAGYLIRARIDFRKALPEFVYFSFQSHGYWQYIGQQQIQATIQNVSAERYDNYVLPRPPVDEQARIVEQLSGYSKLIVRSDP